MEYHEIHRFINQGKLRAVNNATAEDREGYDFSEDSSDNDDTSLDRHLKKTHQHARHYYDEQPVATKRSWWSIFNVSEDIQDSYHPYDLRPQKPRTRHPSTIGRLHQASHFRTKTRKRLGLLWKRQRQRQVQQQQPRQGQRRQQQRLSAPSILMDESSPDPLMTIR